MCSCPLPVSFTAADDQSMCAVFEIAGRDQKGLLASVMELLSTNACEAQSAAVGEVTLYSALIQVVAAQPAGPCQHHNVFV